MNAGEMKKKKTQNCGFCKYASFYHEEKIIRCKSKIPCRNVEKLLSMCV